MENENIAVFAIIAKDSDKHIGNISLGSISCEDNSGEISILIGEKDHWGRGIGYEAYTLIIDYAFNTLGLQRLYSGMTVRNKGMIRVVEKVGMLKEEIEKGVFLKEGEYVDIVKYAITKSKDEVVLERKDNNE